MDHATEHHEHDGVVEHPTADDFQHARTLPEDRMWFKHAVFYAVSYTHLTLPTTPYV